MADKPTGPVKPPTIDMTAKKTESAKPEAKPEARPAPQVEKPGPAPAQKPSQPAGAEAAPKPQKPTELPAKAQAAALPIGALVATGAAGALAGLALSFGLAQIGYWPAAAVGVPADAVAALETRIARAENSLELADANIARLAEAAQTAPEIELPDDLLTADALAPLAERIEALGLRLDAVAAGMPGDESEALTSEIARLGGGYDALQSEIAAVSAEGEALDTRIAALSGRLEDLEARAADEAQIAQLRAERDRFAQIAPASAALEAAINAGQPFSTELARLEALLPEMGLTSAARQIAANGVKPVREIAADYRGRIPALLAARPADAEAGWLDGLIDQARSAIALRPVDDAGESPEALVGRIEAALEAGDASAARALVLSLPEPMQEQVSGVRADLDAVIAARAILADIRALAPATSGENAQ